MLVAKTRTWKTAKQPFSLTEGQTLPEQRARQEPGARSHVAGVATGGAESSEPGPGQESAGTEEAGRQHGPWRRGSGTNSQRDDPRGTCSERPARPEGGGLAACSGRQRLPTRHKMALWENQKVANAHIPRPQSLWLGATEPARRPGEATPGPGARPVGAKQTLRTNRAWKTEDATVWRGRKGSA